MDNKMYQDDELEQFLQEEVKQHRMYPSDHIWKNIRTELHGYKAWPALTFISLFIITALTISTLLNNHPATRIVLQPGAMVIPSKTNEPVNAVTVLARTEKNPGAQKDYFQSIAPAQVTAETFAHITADTDVPEETPAARNTHNDYTAVPVKINNDRMTGTAKTINGKLPVNDPQVVPAVAENILPSAEMMSEENKSATVAPGDVKEEPKAEKTEPGKPDVHSSTDEFLKDFNYVTNRPKPRNSKFGIQFYFTPSTSYRKLSDEKVKEVIQPATGVSVSSVDNIPRSAINSTDINNVVRHKPAMGLEAGFAILYNMTDKLKFKTGLQLNVRQYYIKTFESRNVDTTSLSVINSSGVETISRPSPYNNNTGYRQAQLDNQVYQVSLPLGIQWDALQGKHFGITAEASVQPTLTLNTETYLLSTDYKLYTDGKDFMRKWNINTSVGINLTYQGSKGSWQLGPQIRYQHMPTYSNLYPIKEYLMDYGIRIGYTRSLSNR